jgi:hypothetical protein
LTYCDGTNPTVVAEVECTIPLLTLQASPFDLQLGDSVIATVTATNSYGESSPSSTGNGAAILLVPSAPVGLAFNSSITTASIIGLTWNNGVSTGGSPVIDYRISYD